MSDLRILVVDDSPTMRRILLNTIQKAGYTKVKDAEDGRDAYAKLIAGEYDLLMTDWNMPNMNGLELTEAVRKNDKYKDLPILMITTRSMKENIVSAVKAGVTGYIVKPFDAKTLNTKIAEVMVTQLRPTPIATLTYSSISQDMPSVKGMHGEV